MRTITVVTKQKAQNSKQIYYLRTKEVMQSVDDVRCRHFKFFDEENSEDTVILSY